jgi:hypothetical protein
MPKQARVRSLQYGRRAIGGWVRVATLVLEGGVQVPVSGSAKSIARALTRSRGDFCVLKPDEDKGGGSGSDDDRVLVKASGVIAIHD